MKIWSAFFAAVLVAAPLAAGAQEASLAFGGDQYTAGQNAGITANVERDAFIAGYDVAISAPVAGDGHIAGFNVRASAPVTGDIYAAGFSVSVTGAVGGDLTAMGNSVSTQADAAIGGNARIAAQTVSLGAPVAGSALVTAQNLNLNSVVSGDLTFLGETMSFGPNARIDGQVHIRAPANIAVPASVAAADRVSFTELVRPDYVGEAGRTAENVVRGFWPVVWGTVIWLAILVVAGALLIALLPRLRQSLETAAAQRPLRTFGLGILTFASTLGLVPVAAITVIGIFILPFVFIYVAAACAVAYLVGIYLVGLRVGSAFASIDTNLKRLVAFVVAAVAAVLLGLVPFVGWLLTLLLATFGFGSFAVAAIARWNAKDAARLASAPATDPAAG